MIERMEQRSLLAADLEPIKILNPYTEGSFPSQFEQIGNVLFFTARNELGIELWKTDGTEAGTVSSWTLRPVREILCLQCCGSGEHPFTSVREPTWLAMSCGSPMARRPGQ